MIYKQKGVFKAPFLFCAHRPQNFDKPVCPFFRAPSFCNGADAVRGKENGLVQ